MANSKLLFNDLFNYFKQKNFINNKKRRLNFALKIFFKKKEILTIFYDDIKKLDLNKKFKFDIINKNSCIKIYFLNDKLDIYAINLQLIEINNFQNKILDKSFEIKITVYDKNFQLYKIIPFNNFPIQFNPFIDNYSFNNLKNDKFESINQKLLTWVNKFIIYEDLEIKIINNKLLIENKYIGLINLIKKRLISKNFNLNNLNIYFDKSQECIFVLYNNLNQIDLGGFRIYCDYGILNDPPIEVSLRAKNIQYCSYIYIPTYIREGSLNYCRYNVLQKFINDIINTYNKYL